jgi:integrase
MRPWIAATITLAAVMSLGYVHPFGNPIQTVRVKDGSKRRQRPTVLTVEEYEAILGLLKEPYRTMVIVAQCLGLRVSDIAALQWQDFDFER